MSLTCDSCLPRINLVDVGYQTTDVVSTFHIWNDQVAKTPTNIAVVSGEQQWTYQELERLCDSIARALKADGIRDSDRVGLCIDRSVEAIAAMLAVFKLGAVFVPLDPEYPIDRLSYMISDAEIKTIIANQNYRIEFADRVAADVTSLVHWIDCESLSCEDLTLGKELDAFPLRPSDLAYIMYTSGSTGKPKGVQIDHRALTTYCVADIACYRLTATDRTLQFSTLCFDIAIEEIFPPLLTGGCVVVRPRERANDRNELLSITNAFAVTAIHLATAYWHQWVDLMVATGARVPQSLRLLIVTGEKVSVEHYRRWQSLCDHDVLWCNAYGPTETTVSATVFIPDASFDAVNMPIGKPLPGYEAFILDEQLQEVACGETGYLYIGGPALAVGYLNRPELTQAAFVTATISNLPRRLYRTGDLARWLPDGNVDFAGRVDHQIKLGSYRIEPGEIEAAIDTAENVQGSLVVSAEIDGRKFLVAYVTHGDSTIDLNIIVTHLRGLLPVYMIPSKYVLLESFPKTINGKIDRRALPAASSGVTPRETNYDPPRTVMERRLAAIWQDVLNVQEIGIHDDFFACGGSSLLVTQVVTQLTLLLNIELPVRDFFANPTIATAAAHLDRLLSVKHDEPGCGTSDDNDTRLARQRLPIVEPAFFESDGERLFSVHYRPRSNSLARGVVIAHSIGHEYTRGYSNLQHLAKELCGAGFDVMRFDYAGTGNSSGDCGTLSSQSMMQNLVDAIERLCHLSGVDRLSIVGLRFGATVAANVSSERIERLILWDPVVCGERFLQLAEEFHRSQMCGLARFGVDRVATIDQCYGHRMNPNKRASLASLNLHNAVESSHNRLVVVTQESLAAVHETDWLAQQTDVIQVDDCFRWDDARYTESAFSSPASFRVINERLLAGAS